MLIGEFEHSIDTKGRLVLLAKIKDDLGKEFIVTKGLDGCLFGYSLAEWNKFEEKLKALPLTIFGKGPFSEIRLHSSE